MTARDEVLRAARHLASESDDGTFRLSAVLTLLHQWGTGYADSTIRTHVVSRMCANAPDHHAIVFSDLERVEPGRYRVN